MTPAQSIIEKRQQVAAVLGDTRKTFTEIAGAAGNNYGFGSAVASLANNRAKTISGVSGPSGM